MVLSDTNYGRTFITNVYETSRSFRMVFGGQSLGYQLTYLFFYSDILYS